MVDHTIPSHDHTVEHDDAHHDVAVEEGSPNEHIPMLVFLGILAAQNLLEKCNVLSGLCVVCGRAVVTVSNIAHTASLSDVGNILFSESVLQGVCRGIDLFAINIDTPLSPLAISDIDPAHSGTQFAHLVNQAHNPVLIAQAKTELEAAQAGWTQNTDSFRRIGFWFIVVELLNRHRG